MQKLMYFKASFNSPIGKLWILSSKDALIGLSFFDENDLCNRTTGNNHIITMTKSWLSDYFSGLNPKINSLPIQMTGSDFQISVWKRLMKIPYGSLVTYNDIAKEIAKERGIKKMSAQAVGGAANRNKLPIIIPCHRVVGSNGSLTGYNGGIEKKAMLLHHEGIDTNKLF